MERAQAIGPGEVENALLDLERETLVCWLAVRAPRRAVAESTYFALSRQHLTPVE